MNETQYNALVGLVGEEAAKAFLAKAAAKAEELQAAGVSFKSLDARNARLETMRSGARTIMRKLAEAKAAKARKRSRPGAFESRNSPTFAKPVKPVRKAKEVAEKAVPTWHDLRGAETAKARKSEATIPTWASLKSRELAAGEKSGSDWEIAFDTKNLELRRLR